MFVKEDYNVDKLYMVAHDYMVAYHPLGQSWRCYSFKEDIDDGTPS